MSFKWPWAPPTLTAVKPSPDVHRPSQAQVRDPGGPKWSGKHKYMLAWHTHKPAYVGTVLNHAATEIVIAVHRTEMCQRLSSSLQYSTLGSVNSRMDCCTAIASSESDTSEGSWWTKMEWETQVVTSYVHVRTCYPATCPIAHTSRHILI